ncbi:hypothetical protein [Algoriphagus sp. CAU 1675]|uniref:hypothetical protein n=1 Tax=Algoriphagus sp. CAU 1675 TaxID=3032597 RepID=UPI0023DA095B|nr:hypothetical protein [Algoriphagus sp. CAU 1675]MDF2159278.1 hypothetical protein [Algoriphagus sp. CAU 1675]
MKTYFKLPLFAIAVSTLFSCTEESDPNVLGEGEVKIGVGVKIGQTTSPGARLLETGLDITSGFIQIKKLELETEGEDENGIFERELEYKFPEIKKIEFNELDPGADFFINIPAGNYEEIEVEIDLIDNKNEPSIQLDGTFNKQDGSSVPFRLQVFGNDDEEFDFEVELEAEDDDALFFIDAVSNPLALLQIDALAWFNSIPTEVLENAELTDGTLLISKDVNTDIYQQVVEFIKNSSEIEFKIK